MPRILGIDYGTKKIGFALSDEDQKIAFPDVVLPNEWKGMQAHLHAIWAAGTTEVVVGLPVGLKVEETELSGKVRTLAERIREQFGFTIYFENEVYSSAAVKTATGESRPQGIDAASAALILQSFLDRRKRKTVIK